MPRTATITRKTNETDIAVELNLDGAGTSDLETGVGFFDHMLNLLARHAIFDLDVTAKGDLHVDAHHTVEDVGICLGMALEKALGTKEGINRYGWASVPMDETLANVALDLSGRPAFVFNVTFTGPLIGTFPVELVEEFFKSVANVAKMNLHINVPYGTNNHHIAEAIFKCFARALRIAVSIDPRQTGVPSTKGSLAD
jgi:imidazoleglycerol-phosphate dehydratase